MLRLQYWLIEIHKNQDEILDRLLQSGERQRETERKHYEKEIKRAAKRKKDVDQLFAKTYEDYACERLDEENYEMLRTKYRNEQIQLAEQIAQYEEKLTTTKATEDNVHKWIDLISKYSEINEITAPLFNELIEKIVVHEKRIDTDGKPTRDIEIYYRFVCRID